MNCAFSLFVSIGVICADFYISRIENGNGNPSLATLTKIANGMGKKLVITFA